MFLSKLKKTKLAKCSCVIDQSVYFALSLSLFLAMRQTLGICGACFDLLWFILPFREQ